VPLAAERGFSFADPFAVGVLFVGLVLVAATVAITRAAERAYTSAIVYLGLGAVGALLLEVMGVSLLDPFDDAEIIEHLAEFAVVVALFSAGLRLDRALTLRGWRSIVVMIAVAMPLTIAGVAAFAVGVMGLSLGAAVLLGAILAPTDPVLAGDVQVGPPGSEDDDETRFALTGEAGLNDGFAFPFVFAGLFILAEDGTGWFAEWLVADVVYAIPVGLGLGWLGGRVLGVVVQRLRASGRIEPRWDGWLSIGTVLAVYGLAEVAGAYGFLAAFASGLSFRRVEADQEYHGRVHSGADTVEHVAELALVLLLGSMLTLEGLGDPGLGGWLLVPALLLIIRPLATLAAFTGSRLPMRERLFIGWFGIRGIGSFYYVAVALGAGVLAAGDAKTVFWTVFACTGVSIIVHGLTARPAVNWMKS
jgi:sodium/hydrogen antiporter